MGAMEWWVKATSMLKMAKWHPLDCHFQLHYIPHKAAINSLPNSSASCVVNYSWLSACPGKIQPFNNHLRSHGHLTSLRNKPQQSQPGQRSTALSTIWHSSRAYGLVDNNMSSQAWYLTSFPKSNLSHKICESFSTQNFAVHIRYFNLFDYDQEV